MPQESAPLHQPQVCCPFPQCQRVRPRPCVGRMVLFFQQHFASHAPFTRRQLQIVCAPVRVYSVADQCELEGALRKPESAALLLSFSQGREVGRELESSVSLPMCMHNNVLFLIPCGMKVHLHQQLHAYVYTITCICVFMLPKQKPNLLESVYENVSISRNCPFLVVLSCSFSTYFNSLSLLSLSLCLSTLARRHSTPPCYELLHIIMMIIIFLL